MNQFPKDPAHGTIFELKPGSFFQYDSILKSWHKIEGMLTPPVASGARSGLMPASDLKKLNRLVIPPPQSTITGEDCATRFENGIISLSSGDEYLTIEGEAPLQNVAADIITEPVNFQLHQHTFFFNFMLDQNQLIEHMRESGKFVVRSKRGLDGPKGDPGADGEDALPFGPDGIQGEAGSNATVSFTLTQEPIEFSVKEKSKRALVELEVVNVSDQEYKIVAKRATVGNPNACPSSVRLNSNSNSSWLLATRDLTVNEPVANFNLVGGPDSVPNDCLTCNTELYYIDIGPIHDAIKAEFNRQAERLAVGFEEIISFWLNVMSGLFDDQKAALCCALEFCNSQKRNNDTRRYIESQRIQAAMAGSTITIDGDPSDDDKNVTIMDTACEPEGFGADSENGIPNNADPIGGFGCVAGLLLTIGPNGERTLEKSDQCPPGYVTRSAFRGNYAGGGSQIIIQAEDPRYRQVLAEARGDTTTPISRPVQAEPVSISIYQEVESSGFVHYDMWYVSGVGRMPEEHAIGNMAITGNIELKGIGRCLQFSDALVPGIYTLYLNNRSNANHGFELRIASRNAQFLGGNGPDWDDNYIQSAGAFAGSHYPSSTVISCKKGPAVNKGWWIQVRIFPDKELSPPYSKECGAVGPKPTQLDKRLCKEIPRGIQNPLAREMAMDVSKRGAIQHWVTTKCNNYLVPDAVEIQLSGVLTSSLVLCRTNSGNYTGGANTGAYSIQVLIEQQDTPIVRPSHSHLYPNNLKSEHGVPDSVVGSNKYKATILLWKGDDCSGDVYSFASEMLSAVCSEWQLSGSWHAPDIGPVNFIAKAIDNDVESIELLPTESSETLLYLNARKNVKHRQRRVSAEIPSGTYVVDIVNCCLKSGNQYTGHIEVEFNYKGERKVKKFPNVGTFEDPAYARTAYVGMTMEIEHGGGDVAVSLASPISQIATGEIVVRLSASRTFAPDIIAPIPVSRTNNECKIHAGHVKWLEDAWNKEKCNGVVVEVAGQEYIIVNPTEKFQTQCTSKFDSDGLAFAWPTFDRSKFVAVPEAGSIGFKQDRFLESDVRESIKADKYNSACGDLTQIQTILFPKSMP